MAKPVRLYWDSCAWLGLLNGEADKKRELEIVYRNAKQGQYEIWTSTLSMVEVRRLESEADEKKPLSAENLKTIEDIFSQAFVFSISMGEDIAGHARELFRITKGLSKWQDAVHLASAIRWDVEIMHTYDGSDLLHLDGQLNCQNGKPLQIILPDETTDGPLFSRIRGDE